MCGWGRRVWVGLACVGGVGVGGWGRCVGEGRVWVG